RHGFSWTRPTYVLAKADPARQAVFQEELVTLKKTPRTTTS
ncbi:MAG: transposase, partial [Sulfobacillus acidophilus]